MQCYHDFGIFGRHSHQPRHPHPKHSAGTTEGNGRRHADRHGAVVIPKAVPLSTACLIGCAVVTGAGALDPADMLMLTRWLGFSETTFLLTPGDSDELHCLELKKMLRDFLP